jgi:transcription elongation GreA/GreB family factor
MSVAFRREGDDEHLEPKFEIPIPPGPNLVTERGKALIDARVSELQALIVNESDEEAGKRLKRDLRYWETRQVTAQIMPVPDGDVVAFGTRVTFMLNGKQRVLSIVGDDEADPANDLIAFSAPLARALMDAEAGEVLPFGRLEDAIEVLAVEPIGH